MYQSTPEDLLYLEDAKMPSLTPTCLSSPSNENESEKQVIIFNLETKFANKVYSSDIRQLYYSLLADQIPPAKINVIIKSVLKSFLPSLNVDNLKLPREKCAGYMRREELKTVSRSGLIGF